MILLSVSNVVQLFTTAGITISEDTVRNYADNGKLICSRTKNGTRVFQEKDVLQFIANLKEKKLATTQATKAA